MNMFPDCYPVYAMPMYKRSVRDTVKRLVMTSMELVIQLPTWISNPVSFEGLCFAVHSFTIRCYN